MSRSSSKRTRKEIEREDSVSSIFSAVYLKYISITMEPNFYLANDIATGSNDSRYYETGKQKKRKASIPLQLSDDDTALVYCLVVAISPLRISKLRTLDDYLRELYPRT